MELYKPEYQVYIEVRNSQIDNIKRKICDMLGHRWMYKDYSNFMKSNGDKYHFDASRNCTRCKQNAYFIGKWENREKSKFDFENDNQATQEIIINSINYN